MALQCQGIVFAIWSAMSEIGLDVVQQKLQLIAQQQASGAILLFGEAGSGKSHTAKGLLQTIKCKQVHLKAATTLEELLPKLPKTKRNTTVLKRALDQFQASGRYSPEPLLEILLPFLKGFAPLLLFVEDVHAAEPQIQTFWRLFSAKIVNLTGLGVLFTSRNRTVGEVSVCRVPPLTPAEITNLLETRSKGILPQNALEYIYQQSAGNPLFALQYFRYLGRIGALWFNTERWCFAAPKVGQIPPEISFQIADGLKFGHPTAWQVLSVFALADVQFDLPTIGRILEQPENVVRSGWRVLVEAGVLFLGKLIHPLYKEVALNLLSSELRLKTSQNLLRHFIDKPEKVVHLLDDPSLTTSQLQDLLEPMLQYATFHKHHHMQGLLLYKKVLLFMPPLVAQTAYESAWLLQTTDPLRALQMIEVAHQKAPSNLTFTLFRMQLLAKEPDKLQIWFQEYQVHYPDQTELELAYFYFTQQFEQMYKHWQQHCHRVRHLNPRLLGFVLAMLLDINDLPEFDRVYDLLDQRLDPKDLYRLEVFTLVFPRFIDSPTPNYSGIKSDIEQLLAIATNINFYLPEDMRCVIKYALYCFEPFNEKYALIQFKKMQSDMYETNNFVAISHWLVSYVKLLSTYGNAEEMNHLYLEFREHLKTHNAYWSFLAAYTKWMPYGHEKYVYAPQFFLTELRQIQTLLISVDITAWLALAQLETFFGDKSKAVQIYRRWLMYSELPVTNQFAIHFGLALVYFESQNLLQAKNHYLSAQKILEKLTSSIPYDLQIQLAVLESVLEDNHDKAGRLLVELEKAELFGLLSFLFYYFPTLKPLWEKPEAIVSKKLTLKTFGRVQVFIGDTTKPFASTLGKKLLVMLLEARIKGKVLTKLDLCEQLFAQQDELSAVNSLYVLIHRIRSQLGNEIIILGLEGYTLGIIDSDLEEFFLTGKLELCTGIYLEDMDFESEVRDQVLGMLKKSLLHNAKTQPKEAMRVSKILVQMEPYELTYLALSLQLQKLNRVRTERIEGFYSEALARFQEVGEKLPTSFEDFLASEARSLEAVSE